MRKIDTLRALRDSEYRDSLTAEELALLPAHPAGTADVADESLKSVAGGCANSACSCGPQLGTTILWSCVQPGQHCP